MLAGSNNAGRSRAFTLMTVKRLEALLSKVTWGHLESACSGYGQRTSGGLGTSSPLLASASFIDFFKRANCCPSAKDLPCGFGQKIVHCIAGAGCMNPCIVCLRKRAIRPAIRKKSVIGLQRLHLRGGTAADIFIINRSFPSFYGLFILHQVSAIMSSCSAIQWNHQEVDLL